MRVDGFGSKRIAASTQPLSSARDNGGNLLGKKEFLLDRPELP
jgi:hypothetical protein